VADIGTPARTPNYTPSGYELYNILEIIYYTCDNLYLSQFLSSNSKE
jgi:hypothetical protein